MPRGELLHRSAHGWLGDRVEFVCEPTLETGQRFVAGRQDAVVFEQAAQMGGLFVSAGVIEALMGQRNVAAGESGQQRLDLGGELPGEDAGGPVDTAQRINDGVMASGSCAPSIIITVRSSRRAQRAQVPRR